MARARIKSLQYPLRTLLCWLTIGPPILASAYWSIVWLSGCELHQTLHVLLAVAWLGGAIAGPFLLYGELVRMLSGPDLACRRRRKTRRKVRIRIERYAGGTT